MGFGIPSLIHVPHPSCKSFMGAPMVSACLCVSAEFGSPVPRRGKWGDIRHFVLVAERKVGLRHLVFSFVHVSWFDERICSFSLSQILGASSLRDWFLNECPSLSACNVIFKMLSFQFCCEMAFYFLCLLLPFPYKGH